MSSKDLAEPLEAVRQDKFERKNRQKNLQPTEQEKKIVYSYAVYGGTDEDIAEIMGMNRKTLVKYFSEQLNSGRASAKNKIAQRIYMIAVGKDEIKNPDTGKVESKEVKPNLSALIFLAKVRLGWRETQFIESTVDMKPQGVQIYLPDNGMKAEKVKDAG